MSTSSRNKSRFLLLTLGYIILLGILAFGVLAIWQPDKQSTAVIAQDIPITPSRIPTLEATVTRTPFVALPVVALEEQSTPTSTAIPTETPTSEEAIVFAVIGDYGSGNRRAGGVAELVKSWDPDFIITTGDNNYPSGSEATIDAAIGQFYHEYIYPYKGEFGQGADENRFFPTLGNHDWMTDKAHPYLDYFSLPGNERYYDFTWGPVHFFALDSDSNEPDGVGRSSAQAAWLQESLAASTAPWKIVYMHVPPYSSGTHGSVKWMRWPFADWGVTAVLSGHDHSYERLIVDGLPYFVNGLGGGAIYAFNTILEGSQVRYNDGYGAMRVMATSGEIRFEFIAQTGEVIDVYEISR
jgi:hypothetical protein